MSARMMLKKTDGALIEAAGTDTGELKISGSIEVAPAEGGATAAKQDTGNTSLASIDGKLPVALTSGGGVKTGVVDALPAGANHIGSVMCASAGGIVPTFSTANTPGNGAALPTTTTVYAIARGRESNSGNAYFIEVDTSRRMWVVSHHPTPGTTSHSSALEEQRGIDFGFSLRDLTVFSDTAGYILLVNKASDAVNTDLPMGAHIYPIQANQTLVIGVGAPSIAFGTGFQAVFSTTPTQVTLAGVAHARFSIRGS